MTWSSIGRRAGPHGSARLALAAVLVLAGCSTSGTPNQSIGGADGTPGVEGSPTPGEATLLAGLRLDLVGTCRPLRSDLPGTAVAGLDCDPGDTATAAVRLYLFERQAVMLDAYLAAIAAQGLQPRTDLTGLAAGESSYWPGDGPGEPLSEGRNAHWVDDAGHGHYLATAPPFVLFTIEGTDANVDGLYRWAWRGNLDVPGAPTIWREGAPADPNAKG